jgi:hypothetical protein
MLIGLILRVSRGGGWRVEVEEEEEEGTSMEEEEEEEETMAGV